MITIVPFGLVNNMKKERARMLSNGSLSMLSSLFTMGIRLSSNIPALEKAADYLPATIDSFSEEERSTINQATLHKRMFQALFEMVSNDCSL